VSVEVKRTEPHGSLGLVRAATGRLLLGSGAVFSRRIVLPFIRSPATLRPDELMCRCEMRVKDMVGEISNVLILAEVTVPRWRREVRI